MIEGAAALLRRENVPVSEVESIVHGTTLVTNAVIERRGAKTGMLVTEGFRDILDMGFEQRYDLFDLRLAWPDPLVPRRLRREVPERVGHDGRVVTPLDPECTRAAVRDLVDSVGIEALAICFLHSYANPVHEEAAGELVRSEFPHLHVSRSADVFGNMRKYERWTTATMNAFTQPMSRRGSSAPASRARSTGWRCRRKSARSPAADGGGSRGSCHCEVSPSPGCGRGTMNVGARHPASERAPAGSGREVAPQAVGGIGAE